MKPFLGGMYFAIGLRAIDQHDGAAADEYLHQTAGLLHNTQERHQTIAQIATLWAMQHDLEHRRAAITQAAEAMSTHSDWFADVIPAFLSGVHIAWAFEEYQSGHWLGVESHALTGLLHNPRALRNRGVRSIMARSLLQRHSVKTEAPQHFDDAMHQSSVAARVEQILGKPVQKITALSHSHSLDFIFRAEVNDCVYVVRMAKQGEVSQPGHLLPLLQSAGVPAPRLIANVPASNTEQGMTIEQYLEGSILPASNYHDLERWMEPICALMRRLHTVKAPSFGRLSTVNKYGFHQTQQDWLAELQLRLQVACITTEVPQQALPVLDQAMTMLIQSPHANQPRLAHCDLNATNILVDDNRICGIIDWTDAEGNDPAREIGIYLMHTADIWHAQGYHDFPARLVHTYAHGQDRDLCAKAMAHMMLQSALCLQWSERFGDEPFGQALKEMLTNRQLLQPI